jgi:hypothetical protein
MDLDPEEFISFRLEKHHMVIDEAMADAVGYALDYIRAYVADNPKTRVLVEHTVVFGPQIGARPEDAFGTSDVILDNYPKEVVALDYKHGIGTVLVKDNSQLNLYLAGMRQERGRYQRYRKVIVQPRAPKRKPVQEAPAATDADLTKWLDKVVRPVIPIILDAKGKMKPNVARVAGDHCKYCEADGNCKAQFELTMAQAKKEFTAKDPNKLTPAEMAQMLGMFKTIESIANAMKEKAIAAIHAGVEIPGYRKAWTNARRLWADEDEAAALLGKLGIPKAERYEVKLLSPAKAETALRQRKKWPKAPRGGRTVSPFETVVVMSDSNPTIVPDTA